MKTITKNCLNCNAEFQAPLIEIRRGNSKFCCRSCSSKFASRKRSEAKPLNCECAYCGKKFYRNVSQQKRSKSGIFFCCREHKDLGQRLEFGLTDIHPDHYGSETSRTYRKIAFRNLPEECHRCGYSEVPEVLQVHHIDRDRSNNHLENLEILCPTCHEVEHYQAGEGRWSR
jgi:hypothetical protein